MDIFQRSIHLNAKRLDDDRLHVTSSLLDLEHSFHLELTVRISNNTIEAASASMSKAPLSRCTSALDRLPLLKGLSIERGVSKEIHSRLGGPKGCIHLMELLNDVVRFTSMLLLGHSLGYERKEFLPEEEIIAKGKEKLRNTCIVFADEQKE